MCCFGALVSCCGTALGGCCCSAISDCRVKYGPASRIPYVFIMFLLSIFAIIMSIFGDQTIFKNNFLKVHWKLCDLESCKSNGVIYRVSAVLFLFFIIHALLVKCVLAFHHLFFIIKIFSLIGILVATFWIPNSVFQGYSEFARIGSFLFLIIQVYVLISWALDFNDSMINKIDSYAVNIEDEDEITDEQAYNRRVGCCLKFALLGVTIVFYAVTIMFWGFFFSWFVPVATCHLQAAFIVLTIIMCVVLFFLGIYLGTGSIFCTAVVSFYLSFLLFSALEAWPEPTCNHFAQSKSQLGLWAGIIITACAISYTGFAVSRRMGQIGGADGQVSELEMQEADEKKAAEKKKKKLEDDGISTDGVTEVNESNYNDVIEKQATDAPETQSALEAEKKANIMFHLCMALSSLYLAMMVTNWGTADITSSVQNAATVKARGKTTVYVNFIAEWVTFILYLWTMVAPKVCPSRFGNEDDDDD